MPLLSRPLWWVMDGNAECPNPRAWIQPMDLGFREPVDLTVTGRHVEPTRWVWEGEITTSGDHYVWVTCTVATPNQELTAVSQWGKYEGGEFELLTPVPEPALELGLLFGVALLIYLWGRRCQK